MSFLLERLGRLGSAAVSDVLDAKGLRHQTMAPTLRPLSVPLVAGRAATLTVVAVDEVPDEPYKLQFEAVDAVGRGEILVVEVPEVPEVPSAFWGELITTRAVDRGAVGVVLDGYSRDIRRVRAQGFAVWARGTHPADSCGRLDAVASGRPVVCGGVRVEQGDYLLADEDGVVVIPSSIAEDVIAMAEAKSAVEDEVRADLRSGRSIAETYERFGVM